MNRIRCGCTNGKTLFAVFAAVLAAGLMLVVPAQAQVTLTKVSSDPFTVGPGQHATEVEPHVLANGSTLVSAFQTGRIAPGGSTDIGWATSLDGGKTWKHGFLPGLTKGEGTGPYDAISDPAVAFDVKHNVWMIASLPISNTLQTPAVVVSRSTDGGLTWQHPVNVDVASQSSDKNWIVCDNSATSAFQGHCYIEWDDPSNGDNILMSTSKDGGLTWAPPVSLNTFGIGGQPLVQPKGTVIVPIETNSMSAFHSTNGGLTWSQPTNIASIQSHGEAAGFRSGPLPSAAIDHAGTVYVAWEDCRFRAACSANDIVYSKSKDGTHWSAVTRIPIDATSTTVDHFIPGIGIDPATSGVTAHIGVHYYYFSNTNCTLSSCRLFVGFISSHNGGSTWNAPVKLAGPMQLGWLPNSQNGLMVGDYIATAFTNGVPHGVFAVAAAKVSTKFNEAMNTAQGLTAAMAGPQLSSAGDRPLHTLSDPIEHEQPEKGIIPPFRRSSKRSAK
jgi:hypothetical protein